MTPPPLSAVFKFKFNEENQYVTYPGEVVFLALLRLPGLAGTCSLSYIKWTIAAAVKDAARLGGACKAPDFCICFNLALAALTLSFDVLTVWFLVFFFPFDDITFLLFFIFLFEVFCLSFDFSSSSPSSSSAEESESDDNLTDFFVT